MAQFPYTETFKNNTAPGVVFGGSASSFLTAGVLPGDGAGNGYLRLTDAVTTQKGYVYGNTQFPTNFGLKASFEYFTYGGDGADGICFFLFDATASPFTIGSFGGSLGYAQYNTPVSGGTSKGYLGIGLDEFGNFSNPTEGRQGGPGFRPNAVVLRGKGDGSAAVATNYPYLTGTQTTSLSPAFNISGGSTRAPLPSNAGYRKVDLTLKPRTGGGYYVSVDITTGGTTPTTHVVVDSYAYTTTAPANLKFGFAASTGASTNYHEIRNLTINVFDTSTLLTPTAGDTALSACYQSPVSFNPLSKAVLPNSPGVADSTSIRFITPITGVKTNNLTIAGMGTFHVDSTFGAEGTVTFTPATGFSGIIPPVAYTFKDNYGKEATNGEINITVKPAINNNIISPSGTLHTYNGTLPTGGDGTFSYQWQYSTVDSISGFVNGSGSSTSQNYTSPPITDTTWYRRIVTSNGCPVYSNVIGVAASGIPLPLALLSFDASVWTDNVLLQWRIAAEGDLKEFTLQKMSGILDWVSIATIKPNGTTAYNYTDFHPANGINLYRLKLASIDGSYSYSPVVKIAISNSSPIIVYPNPTTDQVYIALSDLSLLKRVDIVATDGRVMMSSLFPSSLPKVDLSTLSAGLYLLHVIQSDGSKTVFPISKK